MKKVYKMSLIGKIIVIAASVFSIIMISGKWLDLYQIPMIFGKNIPHKYSLYNISDILDIFNIYIDDKSFRAVTAFFSVPVAVIITLNILNIILTLANTRAVRVSAIFAAVASVIVTVVYLILINLINAEMKDSTYGDINELLRATSNPYWLIVFSVLSNIGCYLKRKDKNPTLANGQNTMKMICPQCGAEVLQSSAFCSVCGTKIDVPVQDNINTKFCTNCGAKISVNAEFCTECGSKTE